MSQNCEKYIELTPVEKARYIGELLHVCQSDDTMYQLGLKLIEQGKFKGLFEGVEILPPGTQKKETT